jgi:hypothetical protein
MPPTVQYCPYCNKPRVVEQEEYDRLALEDRLCETCRNLPERPEHYQEYYDRRNQEEPDVPQQTQMEAHCSSCDSTQFRFVAHNATIYFSAYHYHGTIERESFQDYELDTQFTCECANCGSTDIEAPGGIYP